MIETERVLLEGGPMHGMRSIPRTTRAIPLTLEGRTGFYAEVGRTEAGFRLLRWKEETR